ncbi:hypothetical protein [uncultured Turicibacter sp.]|uniref:hypothetical protein n=1 Tax=uncultured Turicibacter sp. TaxID=297316 RepID=UPI0025930013|nr:hypothetical protein [uncultured Turicibacter sp.]
MNSFGPVITAMVTPFDEYNQLNVGSLRKLIILESTFFRELSTAGLVLRMWAFI